MNVPAAPLRGSEVKDKVQDHGTESVESRIIQLQTQYGLIVNELRTAAPVLHVTTPVVAACFRTAPEKRARKEPGNSILDCFLKFYREVSPFDVLDEKLSELERHVRRMKVEVDALWVNDLMPAVEDVAMAINIEPIRRNRDALVDAAHDILAKVYERTLLECLLTWRSEGPFIHMLRGAVAKVRLRHEDKLWKIIRHEETVEDLPEEAVNRPPTADSNSKLTAEKLIEIYAAAAGNTRDADVLWLYIDGLTHVQIAERLFISEQHSRVLLHRALLHLRRLIEDES